MPALVIDDATGARAGERCDFDGDFRLRSEACFFTVEREGLLAFSLDSMMAPDGCYFYGWFAGN